MKLKKAATEKVLQWVADGLETDEINKRAAKCRPPFSVSRQQVDHYRKTRGVKLDEIKEQDETSALQTGLALKEERVAVLQRLADKMIAEIMDGDKMWLLQVKGIGGIENYERIEYYDFNKAEVDSIRGVLDDIAAEVGQRVRKADLTTGGKPIGTTLDLKDMNGDQLATLEDALQIIELAKRNKGIAQPG